MRWNLVCVYRVVHNFNLYMYISSRVREKRSPTSRSQPREQSGVTSRSSPERSRGKKKGSNITTSIAPAPASYRNGDGITTRRAPNTVQAGVQTSARSVGTAASLCSSREDARGLHGGSDSGRGPLSGRTTSRSHASVTSPTDYSTDTPR